MWLLLASNCKYRCLRHHLVSQPLNQAFLNIERHVTSCRLDLAQPLVVLYHGRLFLDPAHSIGLLAVYAMLSIPKATTLNTRAVVKMAPSPPGLQTLKDSASGLSSHMAHGQRSGRSQWGRVTEVTE